MKKAFTATLLAFLFQSSAYAEMLDHDGATNIKGTEFSNGYSSYSMYEPINLGVLPNIPFPFGRYQLDKADGRLQSHAYLRPRMISTPDQAPTLLMLEETRSKHTKVEDQPIFQRSETGWSKLTLDDATKLWGPPRKHDGYYTFDAPNFHHGEENIFHLDLVFNDRKILETYRVRGISIATPLWIGPQVTDCHAGENPQGKPDKNVWDGQKNYELFTTIKCGDDEALLYFYNDYGSGRIDVQPKIKLAGNESDTAIRQALWFNQALVTQRDLKNNQEVKVRPTLPILQRWWGTPRIENGDFYTFDIHCNCDGEPEIIHVDIVVNANNEITGSRLRGTSVNVSKFQGQDHNQKKKPS